MRPAERVILSPPLQTGEGLRLFLLKFHLRFLCGFLFADVLVKHLLIQA
jgi:hypothetical protein